MAEHRGLCESRGSCTVLGSPGGEIPPGDSPKVSLRGKLVPRPESGVELKESFES